MRILHIITRLIRGGAQQNTVLSCAGQVKAGHEVFLAFGPIYGPEGSLEDDARQAGAELIEVPAMRRAILPGHDWFTYRALRKIIAGLSPDIVHTHSSKAGIVGRAAAWSQRVPGIVHTIHGLPFHKRQNRLVHDVYVATERWAARRCHRLVGITRAMNEAFAENRIGSAEQFRVVPSGVDFASLGLSLTKPVPDERVRQRVRAELGVEGDEPVIGIVARLDRLKGHDDLLDVLPEVLRSHPKAHLLFVGDGWHRGALHSRITEMRASERVRITGVVDLPRVVEFLQAMDVMALPSYQEGQGRALVEAMACGCACVGYAAGGIPAVCVDGVTGLLAPVGDRRALARAIVSLLHDKALRCTLAEAGRKHVYEHFSAAAMVRGLEGVYQELSNNPPGHERKH